MPEASEIRSMFGSIAQRYDLANRILCGGVDVLWRRAVVNQVVRNIKDAGLVLDLACGSGDLTFALASQLPRECKVLGVDFCEPMLQVANGKLLSLDCAGRVSFKLGDCLALPVEDNCADAVTIAFGYRNLADRAKGLAEINRVLKKDGVCCILDFTQPYRWFRACYYLYLKKILPSFARWATGNQRAYQYLAASIEHFPDAAALAEEIKQAGFVNVSYKCMTMGIVAIHMAVKT